MKRFLWVLILLLSTVPAIAQMTVVTTCGTPPATLKTGQIIPGFMDINGNACTNSTGGAAATSVSITQAGSVVSSANPLWVQSSSSIPVVVTVNSPPNDVTAGPTAFTSTGTIAVNSQGAGTVGIQATGSGGGLAFSFQANDDGTNWFSINCFTTAGAVVTSASANGNWICPTAGYKNVRVNLTAITSGTETFTLNASAGSIQHVLTTQGVAANISGIGGNAVATGGVSGELLVERGCAGQTVANTSTTAINNAASSSNLKLVTKATSKNVYICQINLVAAAATNVALVAGTLTTNQCDTSTAGLAGGTTAATGWNFGANGGLTVGTGEGIIAKTASTGLDVCLFFSAANQVSGSITWAQF